MIDLKHDLREHGRREPEVVRYEHRHRGLIAHLWGVGHSPDTLADEYRLVGRRGEGAHALSLYCRRCRRVWRGYFLHYWVGLSPTRDCYNMPTSSDVLGVPVLIALIVLIIALA